MRRPCWNSSNRRRDLYNGIDESAIPGRDGVPDRDRRVSHRSDRRGIDDPAAAVSAPTEPLVPVRARSAAAVPPAVVSFADVAERLNPAVVNIDATSRGSDAPAAPRGAAAARRSRSVRPPRRSRSAGTAPRRRHRLHHRSAGPDPDESPRRRRRRSHHGAPHRRPEPARDARRLRSRHRHRADQGRIGPAAAVCAARRFRRAARRRVGGRDWQPARVRAHGHGGRRQLHRPEAVRQLARPLHPDRRGHQFRQQRRPAHQRARRGDRHQRGDQLARGQHRLCGADQPGARDPAAAARQGPRVARLHRRRASRRRSGSAALAGTQYDAAARWCRTSPPARRARARASGPTT